MSKKNGGADVPVVLPVASLRDWRWPNWFTATTRARLDIMIGTLFLSVHGRDQTVGEYIVTHIEGVDDDTVQIKLKRMPYSDVPIIHRRAVARQGTGGKKPGKKGSY